MVKINGFFVYTYHGQLNNLFADQTAEAFKNLFEESRNISNTVDPINFFRRRLKFSGYLKSSLPGVPFNFENVKCVQEQLHSVGDLISIDIPSSNVEIIDITPAYITFISDSEIITINRSRELRIFVI